MFLILAILGILAVLTISTIVELWIARKSVTGNKIPLWVKLLGTLSLLAPWILAIIETVC